MTAPFRSILCPSDLSPTGDRAVALAYAIAAPDATVHLLHLWEPAYVLSPLDATPVMPLPWSAEQDAAHEKKLHARLRALVPDASATRGIRTELHVMQSGAPGDTIRAEAKRLHADAIVMGTHGRAGLARALMGSVATNVLKHADVPVILVKDPAAEAKKS